MNLKGRDIVHQNLHPKIAAQERLFHPNSSLNWLQIDDPELGMHSVGLVKTLTSGFIYKINAPAFR